MEKKLSLLFSLIAFALYAVVLAAAQSLPTRIISHSVMVMDAATGTVVYARNPDDEIPPASLTKLMTMHLAFQEIAAGRASLDEIITPPRESWAMNQPPLSSLLNLAPGQKLSLRELFLGMAIHSGNDAAAATALRFAPSVKAFAGMMNREAAALGLTKTRFVDASGYSEDNMTTVREFTEFCRVYLEAHPESLGQFHSVREFAYPGPENVTEHYREAPVTRIQLNRNTLLGKVEGVDGLKTGYVAASGYNITATAKRGKVRLLAVVLGANSPISRETQTEKLLEYGFSRAAADGTPKHTAPKRTPSKTHHRATR
jgi:D-alanyl-D-alanine carboxypeptidase (penicillin-binding protein 5/6)